MYLLVRDISTELNSFTLVLEPPPPPTQEVPWMVPKEVTISPRLLREIYFCEGVGLERENKLINNNEM